VIQNRAVSRHAKLLAISSNSPRLGHGLPSAVFLSSSDEQAQQRLEQLANSTQIEQAQSYDKIRKLAQLVHPSLIDEGQPK